MNEQYSATGNIAGAAIGDQLRPDVARQQTRRDTEGCAEAQRPTVDTHVRVPADKPFEHALDACKDGRRITRAGWNAAGQCVEAQYPNRESRMTLPYLVLRNAQGGFVPWAPSQGDLFATDWAILPIGL